MQLESSTQSGATWYKVGLRTLQKLYVPGSGEENLSAL